MDHRGSKPFVTLSRAGEITAGQTRACEGNHRIVGAMRRDVSVAKNSSMQIARRLRIFGNEGNSSSSSSLIGSFEPRAAVASRIYDYALRFIGEREGEAIKASFFELSELAAAAAFPFTK